MGLRALRHVPAVAVMLLLSTGCGSESVTEPRSGESVASEPPSDQPSRAPEPVTSPSESSAPVLMPDLVGLPSVVAGRRIGTIEGRERLGLSSDWRSVTTRCGSRPDTVVHQRPRPGTELIAGGVVYLRLAGLDLEAFRGPCEPVDGDLGPVGGANAVLARQFYRFAADPSLGAPFVAGDVWAGIEAGPTATDVGESERADLGAWELDTAYAEGSGPFSALDVVAMSGGYYALHRGVQQNACVRFDRPLPPALADFRAISLTAPSDTTSSCSQWWSVTLFLDDDDLIGGVALGLGAP